MDGNTYFANVLYFVQKKVEIICKLVYNEQHRKELSANLQIHEGSGSYE